MAGQTSSEPDIPVLETRSLVLNTGLNVADFHVAKGLNLIHASREASATVLALTLAGRMKEKSGVVSLAGAQASLRQRFQAVALSGVPEIDGLERLVPAWSVVREQLAWSSPWYKLSPRNLAGVKSVEHAFKLMNLDLDNHALKHTLVGDMPVLERLQLRTALALIARPHPQLLVVDDIDQLRSNALREQFLEVLSELSQHLPVLAISANGAQHCPQVNRVIRVKGEKQ